MFTALKDRFRNSDFAEVFNLREEFAKGRSMLLTNSILSNIALVLISGTFYTAFLSAHGIDIVRVGIISFIPNLAWVFSVFSPMILKRFRRRRRILLFNHIFYYSCIVLGTTVMPYLVRNSFGRTVWFGILLFAGNLSNALLGSGAGAWHARFIPEGNERNLFFSYQNLSAGIVSMLTALISSLAADALAGSPKQAVILVGLRLFAFLLFVLSGLFLWLVPKEYPYITPIGKVRVFDIFTVPMGYRKFLISSAIMILWTAVANCNANTWTYFLLNTVKIKFVYTYIGTIVYAIASILTLPLWRRAINRYSWFSMLALTIFLTGIFEFITGFTTAKTVWLYIGVSVLQGFGSVGTNLIFANLFFLNLPLQNRDSLTAYWNLAMNLSLLVGSFLGTTFISWSEIHGPWQLVGLPFYGSQFLLWIKFVALMGIFVFVRKVTPDIQPDGAS